MLESVLVFGVNASLDEEMKKQAIRRVDFQNRRGNVMPSLQVLILRK